MSPRRTTPASTQPPSSNPTTPKRPQQQQRVPPNQTMIWNFVHKKLNKPPPATQPRPTPDSTQLSTETTPSLSNTPRTQPSPHTYTPKMQPQRTLTTLPSNEPWGDAWTYMQPHNTFRVLSKNISTINPYSIDMMAIATELHTQTLSVFLAQETNTPWKLAPLHAIQTQCRRIYRHSKIATSYSKDSTDNTYQPGGTLTLALRKWASRVVSHGTDELLGQWSYLEFAGKHGTRPFVVSAYRV